MLKSWLAIDILLGYRKIKYPLHVNPATGAVAKQLAEADGHFSGDRLTFITLYPRRCFDQS